MHMMVKNPQQAKKFSDFGGATTMVALLDSKYAKVKVEMLRSMALVSSKEHPSEYRDSLIQKGAITQVIALIERLLPIPDDGPDQTATTLFCWAFEALRSFVKEPLPLDQVKSIIPRIRRIVLGIDPGVYWAGICADVLYGIQYAIMYDCIKRATMYDGVQRATNGDQQLQVVDLQLCRKLIGFMQCSHAFDAFSSHTIEKLLINFILHGDQRDQLGDSERVAMSAILGKPVFHGHGHGHGSPDFDYRVEINCLQMLCRFLNYCRLCPRVNNPDLLTRSHFIHSLGRFIPQGSLMLYCSTDEKFEVVAHIDLDEAYGYTSLANIIRLAFNTPEDIVDKPIICWPWFPIYRKMDFYDGRDEHLNPLHMPYEEFCSRVKYGVASRTRGDGNVYVKTLDAFCRGRKTLDVSDPDLEGWENYVAGYGEAIAGKIIDIPREEIVNFESLTMILHYISCAADSRQPSIWQANELRVTPWPDCLVRYRVEGLKLVPRCYVKGLDQTGWAEFVHRLHTIEVVYPRQDPLLSEELDA